MSAEQAIIERVMEFSRKSTGYHKKYLHVIEKRLRLFDENFTLKTKFIESTGTRDAQEATDEQVAKFIRDWIV